MTAKEYSIKYRRLKDPDCVGHERLQLKQALYNDLMEECNTEIRSRKVRTRMSYDKIIREINVKGNTISHFLNNTLIENWFKLTNIEKREQREAEQRRKASYKFTEDNK